MKMLSSVGLVRIAVVSPEMRVADIEFNIDRIRRAVMEGVSDNCRFFVFPELCLTGYTCGDLFFQSVLIEKSREALWRLADLTAETQVTMVVGAPIAQDGRLFNSAVFLSVGRILGVVPKTFLPNTQEFYEERWFSAAGDRTADVLTWRGEQIPFGTDLLFRADSMPDCLVGVEICEDVWSVDPPSSRMAAHGATVLVNISASPETLGKEEYRRALVQSQSARCLAAYAYASAGPGESSTDLVYSGHSLIAENGGIMAETVRFQFSTQTAAADIDIERLVNERLKNNSFAASSTEYPFRIISFPLPDVPLKDLRRSVPSTPFVPAATEEQNRRCREIFSLQTTGLAKRLMHTGATAVIGISGGLDSTLALLVTAKAFDKLGVDRRKIIAVTMPGPGTTARTRNNAEKLARMLGVSLRIVPIEKAVRQHFRDIGHDETVHDITFENTQARERTQVLMDIANQVHGLVIGTGDLSELALGWCTYNGDHMSMYAVNAGVPKTLVRHLVAWCAEAEFSGESTTVLHNICATPVSPELLPPDENGEISQITEDKLGPYLVHDFFLFHAVRCQFSPAKIFYLAQQAFADRYPADDLRRWLKVFYTRFFSQQFKRSCLPDGPKVGSVVLSPRGDWRMPSDASAALWLEEIEKLEDEDKGQKTKDKGTKDET